MYEAAGGGSSRKIGPQEQKLLQAFGANLGGLEDSAKSWERGAQTLERVATKLKLQADRLETAFGKDNPTGRAAAGRYREVEQRVRRRSTEMNNAAAAINVSGFALKDGQDAHAALPPVTTDPDAPSSDLEKLMDPGGQMKRAAYEQEFQAREAAAGRALAQMDRGFADSARGLREVAGDAPERSRGHGGPGGPSGPATSIGQTGSPGTVQHASGPGGGDQPHASADPGTRSEVLRPDDTRPGGGVTHVDPGGGATAVPVGQPSAGELGGGQPTGGTLAGGTAGSTPGPSSPGPMSGGSAPTPASSAPGVAGAVGAGIAGGAGGLAASRGGAAGRGGAPIRSAAPGTSTGKIGRTSASAPRGALGRGMVAGQTPASSAPKGGATGRGPASAGRTPMVGGQQQAAARAGGRGAPASGGTAGARGAAGGRGLASGAAGTPTRGAAGTAGRAGATGTAGRTGPGGASGKGASAGRGAATGAGVAGRGRGRTDGQDGDRDHLRFADEDSWLDDEGAGSSVID